MVCKKCGRCCQEFSYGLNKNEMWVKKFVKLLEVMRLRSLLKIVKEVKIIMRCKYLDENKLCKIYDKRPKKLKRIVVEAIYIKIFMQFY
ncbi:hypothetical protein ES705_34650 [subsurface metagenome]